MGQIFIFQKIKFNFVCRICQNVLSCVFSRVRSKIKFFLLIQARIAQLVAFRLGTGEVPGSNPGKGKNLSMKISN